ncbi:TlpA disulfide reductase family protein [Hugenholtzia roseola]|uniref:TlpA disulfide reductase family protein n=1 Tax=Hugenholtzia roseola TaxID=1002 RepID=UPI0004292720|nr:TlpA disulfide reductase family protein [Hugenholtzia roseola]
MKKTTFLFALLISTFFVKAQTATITVKVSNPDEMPNLHVAAHTTHLTSVSGMDSISFKPLSADKTLWQARVPNEKVEQFWYLKAEEMWQPFFCAADDDMEFLIEKNQIILQKGKLKNHTECFNFTDSINSKVWSELALQNADDFTKNLKNYYDSLLDVFEKETQSERTYHNVNDFVRASMQATYLECLYRYPQIRVYLQKMENPTPLPASYYANIPNFEIPNNENIILSDLYLHYITYVYPYKHCKANYLDTNDKKQMADLAQCYFETFKKIENKKIRNLVLLEYLCREAMSYEWNDDYGNQVRNDLFSYIPNLDVSDEEKKRLTEKVAASRLLAAGKPFPDFSFLDKDGKMVTLESLKGKLVLVDFWATWCGPCVSEFPESRKLKEKFANEPVEFVYICIWSEKETWLQAIEKHGLKGLHFFIPENEVEDLRTRYQIQGVPTYYLLDKEGNIITKNVSPSENAAELIEKALE